MERDREIERDAGVPIAQIFEFYGPGDSGDWRQHRAKPFTFERVLATCFTLW